jgi:predicted porin
MKKHLIAAAVAGALAVPAMAQVTIGGNIEAGYSSYDNGTTTVKDISQGVINSSRLRLTGSEDLGGGLKAFFRLEGSLEVQQGDWGDRGADTFDRGSEVGLSGPFGEIKLGKFDMPSEGAETSYFGNAGLATSSGVMEDDMEIGSDVAGAYAYTTPKFGGFALTVAGTMEDQGTGDGAGQKYTSFGIVGGIGPVSIKVASGQRDAYTNADDEEVAEVKTMAYSLGYNAGFANIGLTYMTNDDPEEGDDRTLTILSLSAPVGKGITLHGGYRVYDAGGSDEGEQNFKGTTVGASYAFSKRTTLIGMYRSTTGDRPDRKQTYVGVNHSF